MSVQIRSISKISTGLIFILLLAGCVGLGRNRSDESERRFGRGDYQDDYYDGSISGSEGEGYRMVDHRPLPIQDPGARRTGDNGPSRYLNKIYSQIGRRHLEGFGLLWGDAQIYSSLELNEDTLIGRLSYHQNSEQWRAGGGQVIPVRIIQDHGDVIELETISRDDARKHCDGMVRGVLDAYRLVFFVARQDLSPVLYREIQHEFSDGSVVSAPPGVPIRATESGYYLRLARGEIEISVPGIIDNVSLSYAEPGFSGGYLTPEPMVGHIDPMVNLKLNKENIYLSMLPGNAGRPRWVRSNAPDPGSRVYMADKCMSFIFITDSVSPVKEIESPGIGISGMDRIDFSMNRRYKVREGASAWWMNNDRAGMTRSPAYHGQDPEMIDEMYCFWINNIIRLCHDREDVEALEGAAASISDSGYDVDIYEPDGEYTDEDDAGELGKDRVLIEESRGVWVIEE